MAIRTVFTVLIILANNLLLGYGFAQESTRVEFESVHMGTKFHITAYGDKKIVEKAAKESFDRIAKLDQIFSDYKADSELTLLCKANDKAPNQPRTVSPEMIAVLKKAIALSKKSDGAFDVTIGPMVQLWRISRRTQQLPDAKELADAKSKIGFDKIVIDESAGTVKLSVPGMRLDFGGIVKGYAGDEALAIFQKNGIKQVLIAASGDIRVGDSPPGKEGWDVEIEPLAKTRQATRLRLKNQAVSTSGDLFQFVEIKGVRYSHILDPKTGLGLTGRRAVTVVANTGIDADSLTKACSILPANDAIKLIEGIPHAAVLVATREDDQTEIKTIGSKRLDALIVPSPQK